MSLASMARSVPLRAMVSKNLKSRGVFNSGFLKLFMPGPLQPEAPSRVQVPALPGPARTLTASILRTSSSAATAAVAVTGIPAAAAAPVAKASHVVMHLSFSVSASATAGTA